MHLSVVHYRRRARLSGLERARRILEIGRRYRAAPTFQGSGTKLTWCDPRETERARWSQRSMSPTAYRPYLECRESRPTRVEAVVLMLPTRSNDGLPDDGTPFSAKTLVASGVA